MAHLNEDKIKFLEEKAREVRVSLIESLVVAGSGHTAGPLGMADIFTALYFHILNHDPKNPEMKDKNRLLLIALVAIVVKLTRFGFVMTHSFYGIYENDTITYIEPGKMLIKKGVFGITNAKGEIEPMVFRTPGSRAGQGMGFHRGSSAPSPG